MTSLNQTVRFLFKVTDALLGTPVTGKVTGDFTLTLQAGLPGDFNPATEEVTITEESGGWYWATFVPTDALGQYLLNITEDSGDVCTPTDFQVTVVGPSAIVGPYFTTMERIKSAMFPGDSSPPSTYDELITGIIAEVTGRLRAKLDNRFIFELANVWYLDGSGTRDLILHDGPLVSVDSVELVTYGEDPDVEDAMLETLTTVEAYRYVARGLRTERHLGLGWLEALGERWTEGQRNYKRNL